jgi:hypothetical protein
MPAACSRARRSLSVVATAWRADGDARRAEGTACMICAGPVSGGRTFFECAAIREHRRAATSPGTPTAQPCACTTRGAVAPGDNFRMPEVRGAGLPSRIPPRDAGGQFRRPPRRGPSPRPPACGWACVTRKTPSFPPPSLRLALVSATRSCTPQRSHLASPPRCAGRSKADCRSLTTDR